MHRVEVEGGGSRVGRIAACIRMDKFKGQAPIHYFLSV